MPRMAADRASAAIRERSVLYAYCVHGIRAYVRPHPPRCAGLRQPNSIRETCTTYRTIRADEKKSVLCTLLSVVSPYCLRHNPYSICSIRTLSADGEEYVDSTERVRKHVRRQYGGGVDSTDAGGDSTDAGGDSRDAGGDSADAGGDSAEAA